MKTHIWYFEKTKVGFATRNLTWFGKHSDGTHWKFKFIDGDSFRLTNQEDIENFEKNILRLDD